MCYYYIIIIIIIIIIIAKPPFAKRPFVNSRGGALSAPEPEGWARLGLAEDLFIIISSSSTSTSISTSTSSTNIIIIIIIDIISIAMIVPGRHERVEGGGRARAGGAWLETRLAQLTLNYIKLHV